MSNSKAEPWKTFKEIGQHWKGQIAYNRKISYDIICNSCKIWMITAQEMQMQDKSELQQQRKKNGDISSMYVTVAVYLITISTKQPTMHPLHVHVSAHPKQKCSNKKLLWSNSIITSILKLYLCWIIQCRSTCWQFGVTLNIYREPVRAKTYNPNH